MVGGIFSEGGCSLETLGFVVGDGVVVAAGGAAVSEAVGDFELDVDVVGGAGLLSTDPCSVFNSGLATTSGAPTDAEAVSGEECGGAETSGFLFSFGARSSAEVDPAGALGGVSVSVTMIDRRSLDECGSELLGRADLINWRRLPYGGAVILGMKRCLIPWLAICAGWVSER